MLLRLMRDHLRPYRGWLLAIVGLQLVSVGAMLYLPSLNADIINKGVIRGDTHYVLRTGILMLAVSIVQGICSVWAAWFGAHVSMAFGRDLRAGVFRRVGGFSAREVTTFGAPSLITRATNDVQQVQMLTMMTCTMAVQIPILMIGSIVMAVHVNAGMSWLVAVVVPVLAVLVGIVVTRMVPYFRQVQVRLDAANKVLREQITGIRVVRAFVREPLETQRFAEANDELTHVSLKAGNWMATMFPIVMLVANGASVALIWFGGHRIADHTMEPGALMAFLSYLMQIVMSVMMGTFMLMMVPRSAVCADRIGEVLDTDSSVVRSDNPVTDVGVAGHLDLEDVSLTYPGAEQPVLRDVNLTARPGQTVAVIGSTGAGKTTLINLVPRLLDATGGRVLVDGVDVRDLDEEVLWSKLGLIPQKAFLFSGTVGSNLRQGKPDATDEELWEALRIAQGEDFVRAMPEQLDARIAQGGTNVSGGQRQRLAIARALVRRPEIYLFDDAFSALDLATDARLRAALRPVTRDATVVIVAQRIATIRDADQILVLEDGAVVGRGTHDELMADNPTYREIAASQGIDLEEAVA